MTLECLTSGESHGQFLTATIVGLPAGMPIGSVAIDRMLARRQAGYGRSNRMKIEHDRAEIVAGVRRQRTTGGPLTLLIRNAIGNIDALKPIHRPRPGHADLAGMFKFCTDDARVVAERASARETAARVAAGAVATSLLSLFDIDVVGYVVAIGGVDCAVAPSSNPATIIRRRDASIFFAPVPAGDDRIKRRVARAAKEGDTLGGIVEVRAYGVPPGLGSSRQYCEKLDGAIAGSVMTIQTIKGVEIGAGFPCAALPGSRVHDPILYLRGVIARPSNNCGGIEGGMSNGETIVVRAASKPIPTLRRPLMTVDMRSKRAVEAQFERSDVCAVPAASVIAEAVVGFEIARAFLAKLGGDTFHETQRRYKQYRSDIRRLLISRRRET